MSKIPNIVEKIQCYCQELTMANSLQYYYKVEEGM